MKKLLLVLMVVAMASFLFVGCLPGVVDNGDDDNGDDVVVTTTVEIADSVVLDGKTYVAAGTHAITVTFAAPIAGNVLVGITGCSGDYKAAGSPVNVVMFPDSTRKIWTGSGSFAVGTDVDALCCASYVEVAAGECDPETCIVFPVIVDPVGPFAELKATTIACDCATGDQLKITSDWTVAADECEDATVGCCGDYCSGLASWTLDIYDEDPFGVCCAPDPCITAYKSCTGTACPVECLTECDEDFFATTGTKDYYVIVTMTDEVDNSTTYYGMLVVDTDSIVSFHDYVVDSTTCVWTECDDANDILGDCDGEPCSL
jgi:hypothetical protein